MPAIAAGFDAFIAAWTPSGSGPLREVRELLRKLFIAFVAAAVVPVLVLAFVTARISRH